MPNHIEHRLVIVGTDSQVKKVLKEIKTGDNLFDFNTIIPMPSELEGTQSPEKIISQKEYDAQEKRIAEGKLTEIEKRHGLSRGITKAMSKDFLKRFGANNWYNWRCDKWGTKWGAYEVTIDGNMIGFSTAWSTPFNIMIALSKKYPKVTFKVEFADEDFGQNVGEYHLKNGTEVYENIPEGGSVEAIEMAINIKADEYYLYDYLCEESEEGNEFTDTLIQVAHNTGVLCDDYPAFVLTKLRELARDAKQIKRIKQIDNLLKVKL
jgi:hypothetical protein